jgi:hypothetical protein
VRGPQHKVRAGLTNLGTVEQQPNVLDSCVLSAERQTMLRRLDTNRMTFKAILNALTHFLADGMGMGHSARETEREPLGFKVLM